eukprot:Clim_evm60s201 gene=Clim_evmTU60s201
MSTAATYEVEENFVTVQERSKVQSSKNRRQTASESYDVTVVNVDANHVNSYSQEYSSTISDGTLATEVGISEFELISIQTEDQNGPVNPDGGGSTSKSNTELYIIIGASVGGAVVVAAIGLTLYIRSHRRRKRRADLLPNRSVVQISRVGSSKFRTSEVYSQRSLDSSIDGSTSSQSRSHQSRHVSTPSDNTHSDPSPAWTASGGHHEAAHTYEGTAFSPVNEYDAVDLRELGLYHDQQQGAMAPSPYSTFTGGRSGSHTTAPNGISESSGSSEGSRSGDDRNAVPGKGQEQTKKKSSLDLGYVVPTTLSRSTTAAAPEEESENDEDSPYENIDELRQTVQQQQQQQHPQQYGQLPENHSFTSAASVPNSVHFAESRGTLSMHGTMTTEDAILRHYANRETLESKSSTADSSHYSNRAAILRRPASAVGQAQAVPSSPAGSVGTENSYYSNKDAILRHTDGPPVVRGQRAYQGRGVSVADHHQQQAQYHSQRAYPNRGMPVADHQQLQAQHGQRVHANRGVSIVDFQEQPMQQDSSSIYSNRTMLQQQRGNGRRAGKNNAIYANF